MMRSSCILRAALVCTTYILAGCATENGHREVVAGRVFELRPTEPGAQAPSFDEGDAVETHDSPSGDFRLHFARAGRHAVPLADADESGVPDFIERVSETYDAALAKYLEDGFEHPVRDADGLFDVYLVDFGSGADGAYRSESCTTTGVRQCAGYMVQDNDFAEYSVARRESAIAVLASHELFHAVQAAYDDDLPAVFSEGTAVWATEMFDPELDDFEGFARSYFADPSRSLEQNASGPVDAFTYGSSVFFRFLSERYSEDVIRELLEDSRDGANGVADPRWFDALGALLTRGYESTYDDAILTFAEWCLRTGRRADPSRSFTGGAELPLLTSASLALPHTDDRLRILRSSMVPFVVDPAGREEVRVALSPANGESLDGLFVVLATEVDGAIGESLRFAANDADIAIAASDADKVHVVLVRAHDDADSRAPAFCIGDADETSNCFGESVPDAGLADAAETPQAASSRCTITSHATSYVDRLSLFFAAILLVSRHRGRARTRARSAG